MGPGPVPNEKTDQTHMSHCSEREDGRAAELAAACTTVLPCSKLIDFERETCVTRTCVRGPRSKARTRRTGTGRLRRSRCVWSGQPPRYVRTCPRELLPRTAQSPAPPRRNRRQRRTARGHDARSAARPQSLSIVDTIRPGQLAAVSAAVPTAQAAGRRANACVLLQRRHDAERRTRGWRPASTARELNPAAAGGGYGSLLVPAGWGTGRRSSTSRGSD